MAAAILRPSTPPPPSSIRTPTTPRFGYDDSYEPYSPRRKSARVSQRSQIVQTPPQKREALEKTSSTSISSSFPPSPQTVSRKTPGTGSRTRKVPGALSFDTTDAAAEALGLPTPRKMDRYTAVRNNGMLPTPDKTPNKRPSVAAPAIKSVARNLFPIRGDPVEEAMPSPKKKGRKYKGFSLDNFEAEEDGPIQIFTDSHDRVPEADSSTDNPFYAKSSAHPEPTKRVSKRRKIAIPGEGEQDLAEAERREDGMVYVFRGKKIFRKFADGGDVADHAVEAGSVAHDSENEADTELDASIPLNLRRPLTRSSVKPRLLFPTPQQSQARAARSQETEDEEEAVTDIEDVDHDTISTPIGQLNEEVTTPKAPKYAPASPPTTARVTRSKDAKVNSPAGGSASIGSVASVSPFDSWQRTKRVAPASKKRSASPSMGTVRGSKKIRG